MELRVIEDEYAFDHRLVDGATEAGCKPCGLVHRREMTECLAFKPKEWNGLMIVGEGPGATEARLKVPFVGSSGGLLDKLLDQSNITRENTYITNATLCQPGAVQGVKWEIKQKDVQVKSGVQHCRPRLLREIEFYQPRVILALGQAALDAITGSENRIERRKPFDCPVCENRRKWKVWRCAKCKPEPNQEGSTQYSVVEQSGVKPTPPGIPTPCCSAKWQPKTITCTECKGLKTKPEVEMKWESPYKIGEVAGGVFRADTLPIASLLKDPEHTYVIPTYHPSFLLRKAETKAQKQIGGQFLAWAALLHFRKAARLLDSDPVFPFRWRLAQTPEEIRGYINGFAVGGFAVDTETDAKDPLEVTDIRCISFCHEDSDEALVVDTSQLPANHPLVQAVCEVLRDPSVSKIGQNFIYDMTVIERVWQTTLQGFEEDTLIGHNVICPDEPHDLGHIAFLYTDTPPWKPPKKSKKGGFVFESKEQLFEYNGRDTRTTALSMKAIRLELDKEHARQVHDLDVAKFKLAKEMTERGMPINRKRMLELGMEAQYEMEQATHEMRKLVGRIPDHLVAKDEGADGEAFALKPTKPAHLVWALFDKEGPFKLAPMKFTDTKSEKWPEGTPQTGKTAVLDYVEHPFVIQLLRYKANQGVKTNIVDGNTIGTDMRIHPRWNPVAARTGRWASSPLWLNIPKRYRVMVEAPPGRRIVGADASQLELRLSAAGSGDKEMIRRCIEADEKRKLEPDHDPHSFVASVTFGTVYTSLLLDDPHHQKSNPRCACQTCTRRNLRDICKRVIYGLNYGAGAPKMRESIYDGGYEGVPITIEVIEQSIKAIFKAFPRLAVWREETLQEAMRTGYVRDGILNRFRTFPLGDVDAPVAYNFFQQSTAASVMDIGILDLYARLHTADPSAFIFAQVHDAVYVECDERRVKPVSDLVTECMSSEVKFHDDAVWMPLPANAHDGADWLEAA